MGNAKIYEQLVETIQQRLAATGIPHAKAVSASVSAVDAVRGALGGTEKYLPKRSPWEPDRDLGIRRDFDGRNLDVVCRKYGVSRATVYRKVRG